MQDALKTQRRYYSGKKKRHTQKLQLVIDQPSQKIICTAYAHGRRYDFRLFQQSQARPLSNTELLADKGYLGLAQLHPNSYTPRKKRRGQSLSPTERHYNRELARLRVVCEHVVRRLKIFKILSERYRNRRRRFGLRCNLIAGLYNFELSLSTS